MHNPTERMWVTLTNSTHFRRMIAQGAGARLIRSRAVRQLMLARRHAASYYLSRRHPDLFDDVKTFCLFIGHNKSGSSMLSALLDAHPAMVIADEAGAVQDIAAGFDRDQLFHYLLRISRREAMKGRVTARRLGAYSFAVPGQWQGGYETLQVIGDSTTGSSTQRFGRDPHLLPRIRQVMAGIQVKFVQVIRNPYDPISYMMVRGQRSFENAIEHYFANCRALSALRAELDPTDLLSVRYEEFIDRPDAHLQELCRFLGVDAPDDYLAACTGILRPIPDRHRQMVHWDQTWIDAVQARSAQVDFLAGYTFESEPEFNANRHHTAKHR